MRLALFLLPLFLLAEGGPDPILKEDYEEISRAMLLVQSTQLAIVKAQQDAADAQRNWQNTLQKFQMQYKATGCNISLEKKWINCPPTEVPKGN